MIQVVRKQARALMEGDRQLSRARVPRHVWYDKQALEHAGVVDFNADATVDAYKDLPALLLLQTARASKQLIDAAASVAKVLALKGVPVQFSLWPSYATTVRQYNQMPYPEDEAPATQFIHAAQHGVWVFPSLISEDPNDQDERAARRAIFEHILDGGKVIAATHKDKAYTLGAWGLTGEMHDYIASVTQTQQLATPKVRNV